MHRCIKVHRNQQLTATYITPCQLYHWNLPCLALTVAVSFRHLWLWVCCHSQTCSETTTNSGSVSTKALIDTVHRTSWAMTTNAAWLKLHTANIRFLVPGFFSPLSMNRGLVILLGRSVKICLRNCIHVCEGVWMMNVHVCVHKQYNVIALCIWFHACWGVIMVKTSCSFIHTC